jgi:TolB-like protein/class 3 adenylate cyclase/tetratricopeptide (TPR) repeat protein
LVREQRRLSAVVCVDVVGYSRLVGVDEAGTLARLRALRTDLIDPQIAEHGGRIVKTLGDGLLVEFGSVVDAVRCAVAVQREMAGRDAALPGDRRIALRIGVHMGDIVIDGEDILGDGVNVAARLEALAEPGGVCVSGRVQEDLAGRFDLDLRDGGEQALKNIARPVRVWRWSPAGATSAPTKVPQAGEPLPLPDKPSIAVLPFANLSGDPEQEYFADGVVEDIITALSRFKSLFVIARNSSFAYKGKSPDIRQVGRELGVRYVLEGSIRKAGGRLRLTGQLIDASTGAHIWADRFDGALEDVFDLQDRMTGSIVGAIQPKLRTAEIERAQRKSTGSLQAYDLMLRALLLGYGGTREGLDEAARLMRRAIAIDPQYAVAHAELARCLWTHVAQGWMDRANPAVADICELARKALDLDRDDPEVLSLVASIVALPGGEFDAGVSLIEKAMALNPNSILAFRAAGVLYAFRGDVGTAIETLKKADRLNPLDAGLVFKHGYTLAHFVARDYEAVIENTTKAMRDRPNETAPLRYRAASLGLTDRVEEGRRVVRRILELAPEFTIARVRRHIEFDMNNAFKTPGVAEALYEGLRRVGAPEG